MYGRKGGWQNSSFVIVARPLWLVEDFTFVLPCIFAGARGQWEFCYRPNQNLAPLALPLQLQLVYICDHPPNSVCTTSLPLQHFFLYNY